jgi:iron complex transport system ATP-binding protein
MLKCEHINLSLGGREILRDVSLELKSGKFIAVLGPNGAGKSSLLKVLTGGWKADSGKVYAGGRLASDWDRKALSRRRAVLSQDSALTFNFRALEVVLMGRQPHHSGWETRRDYEIAGEALASVDAEALAGRDYLTLSGGERQRVHLARALAQIWETPNDQESSKERCLLLDEPLNNLDLSHQHSSLRIARKLSGAGVAVLAILHDINLAFEYADEIVLLAKGQQPRVCPTDPAAATESLSALFGWPLRVGTNPFTQRTCVFSQAV